MTGRVKRRNRRRRERYHERKGGKTPLAVIGVGVALPATILPAPLAAQETDSVTVTAEVFAEALAEGEARADRFRLYTGCAVDLVVEGLEGDGEEIGLTESQITTAVRSPLRAARIYDPEASDYLYVNVNVLGGTGRSTPYSLRIELGKWLYDLLPDGVGVGIAGTWSQGGVGEGDGSFILTGLAQQMDAFIDQYLRVNECGQ
ncbi:hypothetical protein [Candidatus Palauibacter sp.]|uniref:hypothetical protein n=1 Tax=Candidatus Palauibacter sp. TaxID=3101350 RepID=UPI003B521BEA